MKNIKVIAFDADDTLWVNEPYHTTWAYEKVNIQIDDPKFYEAEFIKDVINFL